MSILGTPEYAETKRRIKAEFNELRAEFECQLAKLETFDEEAMALPPCPEREAVLLRSSKFKAEMRARVHENLARLDEACIRLGIQETVLS